MKQYPRWIGDVRYCLAWILGTLCVLLILLCHDGTPLYKLIDLVSLTAVVFAIDLFFGWLQNRGDNHHAR